MVTQEACVGAKRVKVVTVGDPVHGNVPSLARFLGEARDELCKICCQLCKICCSVAVAQQTCGDSDATWSNNNETRFGSFGCSVNWLPEGFPIFWLFSQIHLESPPLEMLKCQMD